MDAQPPVFSGTLKVHACHILWAKTPVLLTYHRQDYRQALPVLLVRRSGIFGGEFRIPLDPCIHPVRLLPVSSKMTVKLEFAVAYGWHKRQVRFRAPDAGTYRQWTSLIRAALESGRRPLATCSVVSAAESTRPDVECCSSLASTLNSSNSSATVAHSVAINRRLCVEKDRQRREQNKTWRPHCESPWQSGMSLRCSHEHHVSSPSSAVDGSCCYSQYQTDNYGNERTQGLWRLQSIHSNCCSESASVINELLGRNKAWCTATTDGNPIIGDVAILRDGYTPINKYGYT